MTLTLAVLIAAGVAPTQARIFIEPLQMACARFDITKPARIAGFIANCRVESDGFTRLEEGLYYTTTKRVLDVFGHRAGTPADATRLLRNPKALANKVYAGRLGNGDEASGDGWRYRGRGLKQLTGRANYADAAVALGRPYVEFPDMVALPTDACLTAAWFWHSVKGNALADSAQWRALTRAINGPAELQADLRQQYAEQALAEMAAA